MLNGWENINYTTNNQFITKLCCNNLLCRPEYVGYLDCNTQRHKTGHYLRKQ